MNLPKRNKQGIVLVVTVLVLSILLVIGYAIAYSAGVNLHAARNGAEALRRETEAASALNYALALLQTDAESSQMDALHESWAAEGLSVQVGGSRYAIRIIDENRKLNVNRAARPPAEPAKAADQGPVLRRLIINLNGSGRDFDAICAWINPDKTGPNSADAPKKPLPMIAALHAIPALSPDLFVAEENKPALSDLLATHPEHININTASERLLDALFGALFKDSDLAGQVVDRRKSAPFRTLSAVRKFLTDRLPSKNVEPLLALLGVKSDYFTVRVTRRAAGKDGGEALTALVSRTDGVQVLSIQRVPKEEFP